jgi:hypothetical protein
MISSFNCQCFHDTSVTMLSWYIQILLLCELCKYFSHFTFLSASFLHKYLWIRTWKRPPIRDQMFVTCMEREREREREREGDDTISSTKDTSKYITIYKDQSPCTSYADWINIRFLRFSWSRFNSQFYRLWWWRIIGLENQHIRWQCYLKLEGEATVPQNSGILTYHYIVWHFSKPQFLLKPVTEMNC